MPVDDRVRRRSIGDDAAADHAGRSRCGHRHRNACVGLESFGEGLVIVSMVSYLALGEIDGCRLKADIGSANRGLNGKSTPLTISLQIGRYATGHGCGCSSSRRVKARQAASMSGARINAWPISTASTPASSSRSICSMFEMPDSATTVLPGRNVGQQLEGGLDVDLERGEIAVVDADHVGVDGQRLLKLGFVVHLDQRVEVERAGLVEQRRQLLGGDAGDDDQDRVGAVGGRFVELVRDRRGSSSRESAGRWPRGPRRDRRGCRRSVAAR